MKEFKGEQIAEEQLESLLDKLVYEEPQLNEFEDVLVMEIKYNYDD